MSDMRHVYNAYAAIYNPEIKKNLEESRDAFSKMNLNQLNDQDLYEVSEEILEKVFFHHDLDVPTAESLIEAILSDAIDGDKSPLRLSKIERLTEAFAAAFDRVKEKSIRVAKESYTEYLYKKDQLSRLSSNNDLDLPKQRLHQNLVAEDRKIIKSGILEIIEGKINAGLQAYLDKKKGKKTDDKKENGKEENGNGKSSKGGKPDFLDLDKDGDKKESMKKAAKDKKMNEAMIVTNADKKGNTPAYQAYKAGKKNVKTGEPMYKAADHMKEDLLASGVFSEHEVTKLIWNEFDTEIEENYRAMRNPEKYKDPDESDKPYHKRSREARMRDPERGINSPAFKKFMADRGMSV
ncbi:MAG: hypothetical protein CM15mL2_1570 [Caudoviricetes sp.]|nr:MAG: hypothetical protein CM15mL2_1570 [Caudoviricetes sp.]